MGIKRAWRETVIKRARALGEPVPKRITKKYRNNINKEFRKQFKEETGTTVSKARREEDTRSFRSSGKFAEALSPSRLSYNKVGKFKITVKVGDTLVTNENMVIMSGYQDTLRQATKIFNEEVERFQGKQSVVDMKLIWVTVWKRVL